MTPIVFNYFCKKLHLKPLEMILNVYGFKYVRVLSIHKFCKYGSVLNKRWNTIMEGFRIFQDSEYMRFLHMQALHKVLNMPENG